MDRFPVILADPAWPYEVWNRDTGSGRSAESHYETMTWEALAALPVAEDLAAPDACLFLWTVNPSLPRCIAIGESWGFTYKTKAFCFVKRTSTGRAWFSGLGYWSRANTEDCYLFTRGNPRRLSAGVDQLIAEVGQLDLFPPIVAPITVHSAKPYEQYSRIEALVEGPYLELFARVQYPGWSTWGHQAPNSIDWKP